MAKNTNLKPSQDSTEVTLNEVQGSDQTLGGNNTPDAKAGATDIDASKIKDITTPKNVFNTKKVAELVGDGGANASASIASISNARAVSFSGGAGNVSKDESATTKGVSPRKSGDRPGRTIDTALRHIDDVPAESFRVPLHTIPQINEGTSAVGYNGFYQNEHAISQKGSGGNPASSKFFRTLDLIEYDNVYFANGQLNSTSKTTLEVATYNTDTNSYDEAKKKFTLGNYLIKNLNVQFSNDGKLKDIGFDVSNLDDFRGKYDINESVVRVAGDAAIRNRNLIETDRLTMIHEAGDETKENWSPLGEVILDSTDANRMMMELEASIGDIAFMSASKLSTALSYQLNKAAKDGHRKVSPMFEMCEGNVDATTTRHGSSVNEDAPQLFNHVYAMSQGSSALYVAMNDSTPKYNTKGKLLSLPLSFKSALETSAKNRGKLKMHNTLYTEFNRQEVFGKVDEDGSGMTPYFISDGAGIILPININDTFDYDINTQTVAPMFTLHYEDLRNRYNIQVYNYLVQGLVDYFIRKGGKIVSLLTNKGSHYSEADLGLDGYSKDIKAAKMAKIYPDADTVQLSIPVTSTTTCISMWDLVVCAATKDVAVHRQYAMDLLLKYQDKNGHYPYSGVISLEDGTIGGSTNVGFVGIDSPLQSRNIPLTVATRLLLPEIFSPKTLVGADTTWVGGKCHVSKVILPWYFNQNQFNPVSLSKNGGSYWDINPDGMSSMTCFDTRGGVSFGNMDRVLALDPEQLRLSMDRMVDIPGRHATGTDIDSASALTYKYSDSDDGMVVVDYKVYSVSSNQRDEILRIGDILAAPRELGLSMVAPAGVITPAYDGDDSNYRDLSSSYIGLSGPSFRCRYWYSASSISNELFKDKLDTTTAINFKARYSTIEATAARGNVDIGISLAANALGTPVVSSSLSPFMIVSGDSTYDYSTGTYNDKQVEDKTIKLLSVNKYLYTRINMLPFVINPFDSNTYVLPESAISEGKKNVVNINSFDDFDFLHMYNVCGFRCGEYSGTEYDRNAARIQQGLGYVQDPYIDRRS